MDQKVDVKEFKAQIIEILKASDKEYEIVDGSDVQYVVSNVNGKIVVTLGPAWVGYDLSISKSILGKEIYASEDTDNYPLDFDCEVTMQIFDEVKAALHGFLESDVHAGREGKGYIIAVPKPGNIYRVSKQGRILGTRWDATEQELKELGLTRLSDWKK